MSFIVHMLQSFKYGCSWFSFGLLYTKCEIFHVSGFVLCSLSPSLSPPPHPIYFKRLSMKNTSDLRSHLCTPLTHMSGKTHYMQVAIDCQNKYVSV